jgi:hypothetical protein
LRCLRPRISSHVQLEGLHIPPTNPPRNSNGPRLPQDPESLFWLPIFSGVQSGSLPSLAFTHLVPRWRLPPTGRHIPAPLGRLMLYPHVLPWSHKVSLKFGFRVRHGGERMARMQQHARSRIAEILALLSFRPSLSDSNCVTFLCPGIYFCAPNSLAAS